MSRCVLCWEVLPFNIKKKLWCDECIREVDKELRQEQDKPYAFYFSFYLRYLYKWQKKHSKQIMKNT